MTFNRSVSLLCFVALAAGTACSHSPERITASSLSSETSLKIGKVTSAERLEYLKKAKIWVDMPNEVDVFAGPPAEDKFQPGELVECEYLERRASEMSGGSPKFECSYGGKPLKVKYSDKKGKNGEVYSEVFGTRLLWLLGLVADRVYPVEVRCHKCPADPWGVIQGKDSSKERKTRDWPYAAVERKDVVGIDEEGRKGWAWSELDQLDQIQASNPQAVASTKAERDALKLLAAFIQHADNKDENQRLACLHKDIALDSAGKAYCKAPFLQINDLGNIFGKGINYKKLLNRLHRYKDLIIGDWARVPVWEPGGTNAQGVEVRCKAHLFPNASGTFRHPEVGEAGRVFLLGRLKKLSEKEDLLKALYKVARVQERDPNSTEQDWIDAWKKKVAQIEAARCQSP